MKSIKEKAHEIGWVYSKNYDPIACKQELCEMAAREGANYVLTEILDKTSKCITIKDAYEAFLECVEEQNNKGYKLTDCDKNSWWEDFKAYTTSKQILANSAKTCKDEQKPAWSEEDEKMFEHIIAKATLHFSSINYLDEEEINFLKSLRPQSQWKPSDEQMDALRYVTNFDYGGHKATLVSLYEQLKKLKG